MLCVNGGQFLSCNSSALEFAPHRVYSAPFSTPRRCSWYDLAVPQTAGARLARKHLQERCLQLRDRGVGGALQATAVFEQDASERDSVRGADGGSAFVPC